MSIFSHKPKQLDIKPNTPEWEAWRATVWGASALPTAIGVGYQSRHEFMAEVKFGVAKPVGDALQRVFDKGHAVEAEVRPRMLGLLEREGVVDAFEDELPEQIEAAIFERKVDGLNKPLGASLDGFLVCDLVRIGIEVKQSSKRWADWDGQFERLPDAVRWQICQQVIVAELDAVLLIIGDGQITRLFEFDFDEMEVFADSVVRAWRSFERDLETFELLPPAPVVVAGEITPVVVELQITSEVLRNNLPLVSQRVDAEISKLKTELVTDKDVVEARVAVRWFKSVEDDCDRAENLAKQSVNVAPVFSMLSDVKVKSRRNRLAQEKLVEAYNARTQAELVSDWVGKINSRIRSEYFAADINSAVPMVTVAQLAGCLKGLRTIESMGEALRKQGEVLIDEAKLKIAEMLELERTRAANQEKMIELGMEADNYLLSIKGKPVRDFELLAEAYKVSLDAKIKGEAERLAKAEAERLAKVEAERLAKVEVERLAKVEAERLAKAEAERLAKAEAERLAKVEVERLAKVEAERLAKAEAERQAKAEAESVIYSPPSEVITDQTGIGEVVKKVVHQVFANYGDEVFIKRMLPHGKQDWWVVRLGEDVVVESCASLDGSVLGA